MKRIKLKNKIKQNKLKRIKLERSELDKEIEGDIWSYIGKSDAICIPINSKLNSIGENIMGKGLAKQAKEKYPNLPKDIAIGLSFNLNASIVHKDKGTFIIAFKTKYSPFEKSNLELIKKSCYSLSVLAKNLNWKRIILPRVGCGCGKLSWEKEVKPMIQKTPLWKLPVSFIHKGY